MDSFENMKVAELRAECIRRGLRSTGNKSELQERLRQDQVMRLGPTAKLDIEVPAGAAVGDRLTFHTEAGQYALKVPPGATPGRKLFVTMPVPASFPPGKVLTALEIRINEPPLPKPSGTFDRAGCFQIFYRYDGRSKTLNDVHPSDTIMSLMLKIEDKEGLPSERQIVRYGAKPLSADSTVAGSNIQKEATLEITVRWAARPAPEELQAEKRQRLLADTCSSHSDAEKSRLIKLGALFMSLPMQLVAEQIDDDDRFPAALSCRPLRDALRRGTPPQLQLKTRVGSAVASFARLKWSLAVGCPRERLCEHAAALPDRGLRGTFNRSLITYMRLVDGNCPWGRACDAAAARGNVPMVEWMHSQDAPWGPSTTAALASHQDAFKLTLSCDGGDLTICRWRQHGDRFNLVRPIDRLLSVGCPVNETCFAAAATVHTMQDLSMLRTKLKVPWDERTCTALAEAGATETLKWARDDGCPCDAAQMSAALARAVGAGRLDVGQLLSASFESQDALQRTRDELSTSTKAQQELQADLQKSQAKCQSAVLASLSKLPLHSRYQTARTVQLDDDDSTRAYLVGEFLKSRTRHRGPRQGDPHRATPLFEVQRVEQLVNPRLQDKYLAELQDIAGLCERRVRALPAIDPARHACMPVETHPGLNLNERLLFHGAPSHLVDRLRLQGLDPRRAGSNFGKLYGSAVYLAANSSKSDIYTEPNAAGERCVLVVRACLGEAHLAKQAMQSALMPPERPDGRGPLNSVAALTHQQGGVVEHPEYMVYASSQCLPMFAIWYKHHANCGCTHCC